MNAACLMCYRQDVARHLTSVKSWKQTKEFADSILKIKANQLLRIHKKLIQQDVGLMCSGEHQGRRKTEIIGTLPRTVPTFANAHAFSALRKVWMTRHARYHAGNISRVNWEPAFRFIEENNFRKQGAHKKIIWRALFRLLSIDQYWYFVKHDVWRGLCSKEGNNSQCHSATVHSCICVRQITCCFVSFRLAEEKRQQKYLE